MSNTPKLVMPYLVAGQAQKEITHNDALNDLDSLAQISVINITTATPPVSPAEGDSYIIAASPTGVWAGNANAIASYYSGWRIKQPSTGWFAYVQNEGVFYLYDGSAWNIYKATVPAGSAALPSYSFVGDSNTGMYSPGADQVALATNGVQRLTVDASGAVAVNGAVAAQSLATSGNISAPAWTTAGVAFKAAAATFTDTSSSGTVTAQGVYSFGQPTLIASAVTTYTNSATVIIRGAPVSSTNVTQSNAYALYLETGNLKLGSGNVTTVSATVTGGALTINGNISRSSWTTVGAQFTVGGGTLTDTSGSGTITIRATSSFAAPVLASNSAVTVTDAATVYVVGAPTAGTNTTLTRSWSQYLATGNAYFGGSVVIASAPAVPNANALLDIQSTTKAFMPPRMTTTQKNAIASLTSGMVVYDSTLNKLCVYGASAWETITSV